MPSSACVLRHPHTTRMQGQHSRQVAGQVRAGQVARTALQLSQRRLQLALRRTPSPLGQPRQLVRLQCR